jgi:hypothetical protein
VEIDTNASPQAFWAAKTSLSVIALFTIVVFRLEGAIVLLGCATAVWTTNRASEANITVANNAETLVFQNFMIVIVWEYYLANRLINSALKTAKYRLIV